ncbi:Bacterial extracellular solute-binding proteins, family 3 [Vibrio aerogenes CECT 7868]|uniref:Bacterial extracellular solute-binding proteins, family 3 n=1 Tax=Vibrio aerogenes CECT 7868 TaxID=1216006 RepID=A0A1M5VM81_9VIBR|nr:transporter substrate-binding domain-containing protein [Vibrio aerogenes]SHH76349.1 Bacterial extracellular solute-binding proteins, family 3 [Vibrio aerogenes CECT 7868]
MRFQHTIQPKMVIIGIYLLLFPFLLSAQPTLKISSPNVPPFVYQKSIPFYGCGLGCEIVQEAFRAVSLQSEVYIVPLTRAVWSVIENKSTASLGFYQWFKAEGFASEVEKVDILAMNLTLFYKKKHFPDGFEFHQFADLLPYTISSVRGGVFTDAYEKAGLNVSYSSRIEQNIMKLEAERVDLAVIAELSGWQIIRDRYPEQIDSFATIENPVATDFMSVMFRKEDEQLRAEFLRGLKTIAANGTYQMIMTKYYQRAGIDTGRIRQDMPEYLRVPEAKQ